MADVSQARIASALERIADALEDIEHKYVEPQSTVSPADRRKRARAARRMAIEELRQGRPVSPDEG